MEGFIREASERHGRPLVRISDEAMRILQGHSWPGNVRELKNLVESMVVLAPGRRIEARDIPDEIRTPTVGVSCRRRWSAGASCPLGSRGPPFGLSWNSSSGRW